MLVSYKTIGRNIRRVRVAAHLTQEQMAEKLKMSQLHFGRLERGEPAYASTWSERHAAYVAGLGTFSLSKHLITEKGLCGRFGSVITDAPLEVTPRPYTDPYEYCTFCGACVPRCPARAISVEKGKTIKVCAKYTSSRPMGL